MAPHAAAEEGRREDQGRRLGADPTCPSRRGARSGPAEGSAPGGGRPFRVRSPRRKGRGEEPAEARRVSGGRVRAQGGGGREGREGRHGPGATRCRGHPTSSGGEAGSAQQRARGGARPEEGTPWASPWAWLPPTSSHPWPLPHPSASSSSFTLRPSLPVVRPRSKPNHALTALRLVITPWKTPVSLGEPPLYKYGVTGGDTGSPRALPRVSGKALNIPGLRLLASD